MCRMAKLAETAWRVRVWNLRHLDKGAIGERRERVCDKEPKLWRGLARHIAAGRSLSTIRWRSLSTIRVPIECCACCREEEEEEERTERMGGRRRSCAPRSSPLRQRAARCHAPPGPREAHTSVAAEE